tara:strand:+ start:91 stop:627 length:537 start_codon:yes stop_codon:yes gene_type:complete
MGILNVEIKAGCKDPEKIRDILKSKNADFKGVDHQIDTYFNVSQGRLKLREGNIENNLIHYNRSDQEGPKKSDIILFKTEPGSSLKPALTKALGILAVVDKKREIHFIENVKFHVDDVEGLGTFVEIEAIDRDGTIGQEKLQEQCEKYLELFGIKKEDLISVSYSDLLIKKKKEEIIS